MWSPHTRGSSPVGVPGQKMCMAQAKKRQCYSRAWASWEKGVEDRLPQTVPPNPGLCESEVDTPISLADVCDSLKPGLHPPWSSLMFLLWAGHVACAVLRLVDQFPY